MRILTATIRLDAALTKVRREHPFLRPGEYDPPRTILDEVRDKLRETDEANLSDLAYSFDIIRVMACLEIVANDKGEDIAEKAARVLVMRPRDRVISAGWFKLIRYYPHNLLEDVIRLILEEKGFDALTRLKDISGRAPSWFLSKRLSEGVLRDYQGSDGFERLDAYLEENLLNPDDGLFLQVWRLLLSRGNARSLKKEDAGRLLAEYSKPEKAHYVPSFCQHYLNILKSLKEWDDRILELIFKKYGMPSDPDGHGVVETPFWAKVKPRAKTEFPTWLMMKLIDEFFEGERADFWKPYVAAKVVRNVKKILDGDGFMLDFGIFGVVEFNPSFWASG